MPTFVVGTEALLMISGRPTVASDQVPYASSADTELQDVSEWERVPPGDPMSRVASDTTLPRAVSTQVKASGAEEREIPRLDAASLRGQACSPAGSRQSGRGKWQV